jgi:uncharacterized protein involved in exopolysaccharide biosynthesis/Mrp family chromosome partitioning ATPase
MSFNDTTATPRTTHGTRQNSTEPPLWDIADILRILLKRWMWPVFSAALMAGIVLAYALTVPREYAAKTTLVIDPRGVQIVERELTPSSQNSTINLAVIESQISVMTSDSVLRAVVKDERLAADPEFGARPPSSIARLKGWFRSLVTASSGPSDGEEAALDGLRRAVRAERVINSYVIDLHVRSQSPEKAARIANAIAAAYIAQERAGREQINFKAGEGLTRQLATLRERVKSSEEAVEAFKAKHNILSAGNGLVNEQQLSELTNRIVTAGVEASQAQARYDQITALLQGGAPTDSLGEAVQSQTIGQLRVRLAAARQQEAALRASMLPAHPSVRSARASVETISRQIRDELSRIAQTARADLIRARATEQQLTETLALLKTRTDATNAQRVQLRELERAVIANRSVYESYLVRAKEIAGQREVDTSNAQIVTPALPPRQALGPSLGLLLASGLAAGFAAGSILALLREQFAGSPRTNAAAPSISPRKPAASTEPRRDPPVRIWPGENAAARPRPPTPSPGRTPFQFSAEVANKPEPTVRTEVPRPQGGRPVAEINRTTRDDDTVLELHRGVYTREAPRVAVAGGGATPASVVTPFRRLEAEAGRRTTATNPHSHARIGLTPPGLNHRPPNKQPQQEIEILAELDAAQMRNRVLSTLVLDAPRSADARPYLAIMQECRRKRGIRKSVALLVIAPERHMGSAHVALNLASAAVLQGEQVLLVDADVRTRHLTRTLCPTARSGLGELARGIASKDELVWHDPLTFDLLPTAPGRSSQIDRGGLGDLALRGALSELRKDYGVVVIDGGTVDRTSPAVLAAAAADHIVLVVLGRPDDRDVTITLPDQIKRQGSKLLGAIVLNNHAAPA